MQENANTNIFRSNAQLMAIDPAKVRPCLDRVLIQDIPDTGQIGSIIIPSSIEVGVGKRGLLRLGIVVAVGPGDKYYEWLEKGPGGGVVHKKALPDCEECEGIGVVNAGVLNVAGGWEMEKCTACNGTGHYRPPMEVKVGDTVCYDSRREAEVFIEGQKYTLLHEAQSILAVVED